MRERGVANDWEFRWRWPILIGSQPVLAWMSHTVSGAAGRWYAPTFSPVVGWLAVLVATLGILLRVQATTALRGCVMASDDPDTRHFVVHGIYRSVRNPLYLSSLLLFGGYAMFFGGLWAVGFVAFHVWRYRRIVRLEESHLRSEWNEDFDVYFRSVPRWLPRWRELRFEFGRWLSWHGIIANSLYVSLWLGITISAQQGNLAWVIPCECLGGIAMVTYYWVQSREAVVSAHSTIPLTVPDVVVGSGSHQSDAAIVPAPHFQSDVTDRPRVTVRFDQSIS